MDNLSAFDHMPDDARVWTYLADRALAPEEQAHVLEALGPFLSDWTSHQRVVSGQAAFASERVLVLSATLTDGDISGCGIDKSVHRIDEAARELRFSWLDGLNVGYRREDELRVAARPEFRRLVREGLVDSQTRVLDLSATTLGELRSQGVERAAGESWHARVFRIPTRVEAP